jgi:hypothetical protein
MKIIAAVFAASLVLTGCSSQSNETAPSPSPTVDASLWSSKCEQFKPSGSTLPHIIAYEAVINDVCSKGAAYEFDLTYESSETANPEIVAKFTDAQTFALNYWSNYSPAFAPTKYVLFSEKDQAWWEQKQTAYLKKPDLGWFTSKDEGWHCRVEADIFCPKKFFPEETTIDQNIEFRIIGSKLNWEPRHNNNMTHEATHAYQDQLGFSHYREWFIEGQATFYEMAFSHLYYGEPIGRKEYMNQTFTQDKIPFDAKTPKEFLDHIDACNSKYGVGMMYHEKLIVDHGLDTYMEWLAAMDKAMPKGNPSTYNQAKMEKMQVVFDKTFKKVFGTTLFEFEYQVMPDYVLAAFAAQATE